MPDQDPTRDALGVWDAVAPAWERNRQRLFESLRAVSQWLVDKVDPRAGKTILELAAGPGETGFLAAERLGPSGRLISTDLVPAMVEAARRGGRALDNAEFRVMDAQQIDLPDASVDGVLCRFGLMLVPDPGRALAESRRVLRAGGRLAYAVWGPPDRNPWLALLGMALSQQGHPPPGDAFGPGGVFSLTEPERNRELVAAGGFREVQTEEIALSMHFDSIDDYWGFQTEVAGPLALVVRSLPASEVESIKNALEPIVAAFRSANGYEIPALAIGVCAA